MSPIENTDTQKRILNTVSLVEQSSESGLTKEAEDLICRYPLPKEADEDYYERYYEHVTALKIDIPWPIKTPQMLKTELAVNQCLCLCFLKPGEDIEEKLLDRFIKAFPHLKHSPSKCQEWKRLYPMGPTWKIWQAMAQRNLCCGCLGKHTIHECTEIPPRCRNCQVNHATVLFCRE